MINRCLDLLAAVIGLFFLLLISPWVALLIKLDSRGPVFYRCKRVGRDYQVFDMFKFRTMYHLPQDIGPSVSPQGDPRVTTVGRLLRRSKLNEFPQFINLLKGDMTLVGPRPESPDLAALYPPEAQKIFSVKPGLIGPNQILGRNEEELYPPGIDPKKFYVEEILPKKLPIDLAYIADQSFGKNLKYLFLGLWVTIAGAISRRHFWENRSQICLFLGDAALCLLSFTVAHGLYYGTINSAASLATFTRLLPWAVLVRSAVFISMGFYLVLIRHLSLDDLKKVIQGVALASGAFIVVAYLLGLISGYPRSVFVIDWFCLTTLLVGYRALAKKLYLHYKRPPGTDTVKTPVLIWGAGDCGELCLRFLQKEQQPAYEIIGFIDDDPKKRGKRLGGVKILGDRHHLSIIRQLFKVEQVFIAVANISPPARQQLLDSCRQAGLLPQIFLDRCSLPGQTPILASSLANGYHHAVTAAERH
ncbi:MAG: sugar transferase [Desulfobacca sp.]|uniref:sugar transferase n=1 Tax=Desulfobacca sp. TaxID=2067990 RepID=UPI00404B4A01